MGSMKCILKCERISRIDVVVYQSMFAVMRKNEKMKTKRNTQMLKHSYAHKTGAKINNKKKKEPFTSINFVQK